MKLGLITFTVLELVALLAWMANSATSPILAAGILIVGLFLEHIVALNDFKGVTNFVKLFNPKGLPITKLAIASVSEAIVWILWLMVALELPILGAVILLVGIYLQHNAEINIFIGAPTFEKFLSSRVLGFTALEVGAGIAWLVLISMDGLLFKILGPLVLTVGLYYEHIGQGKALKEASV